MTRSATSRLCIVLLVVAAVVAVKAFQGDGVYRFGLDAVDGDLPIHRMAQNGAAQGEQTSWPELVGWDKADAKAHLEEATGKRVFLVQAGSVMTMDFRTDRIRVMFDPATDKVSSPPRVG